MTCPAGNPTPPLTTDFGEGTKHQQRAQDDQHGSQSGRDARITQCLHLLAPETSDESKFAALLLLPRLVDPHDTETQLRILEALPEMFFERMLRTPENSSGQTPASSFRSIAVSVLAAFAKSHSPAISGSPVIVDRIPSLAAALTESDDQALVMEIMNMFLRFSQDPHGAELLLGPESLLKVLTIFEVANGDVSKVAVDLLVQLWITASAPSATPALANAYQRSILPIILRFSHVLMTEQDMAKFEALDALVRLWNAMNPEVLVSVITREPSQIRDWARMLRLGLGDIIGSKIAPECQAKALLLISAACWCLGAEWMFGMVEEKSTSTSVSKGKEVAGKRANGKATAKFGYLVVQLASIEVRLLLDELEKDRERRKERHPASSKSLEDVHVDDASRGAFPHDAETLFCGCIEILVTVVLFLARILEDDRINEQEPVGNTSVSETVDIEMLMKIRDALSAAALPIMEFLAESRLPGCTFSQLETQSGTLSDPFISAGLKFLTAWLAEDDSLHRQAEPLLPLFESLQSAAKKDPQLHFLEDAIAYMHETLDLQ